MGDGALRQLPLFLVSKVEQMVVGRALLRIGKNLIGANDLAELQSRLGVARVKIGMNPFDGVTEGGSEFFGIITRKSSEQIVQRLHRRSHEYSTLSTENPAENLPVENYALILWIVLAERGKKMTELCSLGRLP
jgi:hypothetical protein